MHDYTFRYIQAFMTRNYDSGLGFPRKKERYNNRGMHEHTLERVMLVHRRI